MVVDDEDDILTIFKKGLELHGYSVDGFKEPRNALINFKIGYYDMILLDVRMPGINGFDLARAIWQKDPSAKICFMTAFEIYEDEAIKVFKDFKRHCFLKKPMTAKHLVDHIETHLMNA
jgi:DNA-binding response OmpR family regulator